jgi:SHS2 domain-containing protein
MKPKHPAETTPDWLEAIDHTADAGIAVTAPDLPTLFARAAWGMCNVLTDVSAVRPVETARVQVEATDTPALLVRWLSELNFQHITRHRLFRRFDVRELSGTRLVADVAGEAIDPARHTIYTEIKAITFHGLRIERAGAGWRAQIIFDL